MILTNKNIFFSPNSISIHFAIGARPLEVISSFIPDLMLSPDSLFVRVVSIMRGELLKKLASYFIHNKNFNTRFCFGAPAKQKRLSLSYRRDFHTYNRLQLGYRYLTAIINSFSPIANKISFQKII